MNGSTKISWGARRMSRSLYLQLILASCAIIGCGPRQTTAERFAELLNTTNQYPSCNAGGCIDSISAKGNTVIAQYTIPMASSDFPPGRLEDRATTAANLKVGALKDFCGALQDDFPDMRMQWAGHYMTSDGKLLASILMTVGECPKFQ